MEYRFDFDDQLPDLPIAFDFDEVANLLTQSVWPILRINRPLNVKKLQDVKYRPSQRCVTTYELIVGKPGWFSGKDHRCPGIYPEGVIPRIYTADERFRGCPWNGYE